MMGQQNQMQGARPPGSYGTNNPQRMGSPITAGMASPQQQAVQQRQSFPPQHGAMQNQPQIPNQSMISASLNTNNQTQNLNQSLGSSNNMNTMGASVGASVGGSLSTSGNNISSNNLQQGATAVTSVTQPQTATTPLNGVGTGQAATQQASASAPTNPINTATVCKIGQETVQEIVGRTQEVFSYLKSLQPPVGNADKDKLNLEKQQRLAEVLRGITHLFKRLTFCWNKAQEHGMGGMEYAQLESLIPLKDDHRPGDGMRLELEKKRGGDTYRQALEENNELSQQLVLKNRQLKEIIDQIRNIIWEINTMLSMR